MTYRELGKKVLEQAERPLSVKEIFEKACEMGLDKECKDGKILPHSLGSQLGEHDISNDKKQFYVARKEGGAFFYWLKSREREFPPQETSNAEDDEQIECSGTAKKQKTSFDERDLHPLLVKFLDKDPNFKLLCKTIYHEDCKKSKGGECKWNYPDIVGVYFPYNKYFPYNGYKEETLKFLHHTGQKRHKLFSFELKIRINFSNLKESYFQAVSNSTWANEGYLVVFEEIEDKVLGELRRLNQSFGIGVIKLESEISNSKILLPAKEREIDIPTLNMLVEQSPKDFKPFMEKINKQIEKGLDTAVDMENFFDEVLGDEAMQKHIQKHIKDKDIKNDKGIEAE
ncbi:COG2958 family protein [Helicobacter pylori]|uniref:HTH domain-containing protein n=1 Tax=Helicobacter pylori TaxID=210 RepID=UPI00042F4955|nr:HTH domain-containing protein [Helicobacter pylori]AHN34163.1 HrgA protein [Helicobacter pylori oki102]AHN35634.1 HrgA protein [Helicobacter pylori oki112]AHN44299.1 HrgA protein [Helicobacter pylori oki898]